MIFFDSSAVLPIYFELHVHHLRSLHAFRQTPRGSRYCSTHSLAEVFNGATRPSGGVRATVAFARNVLLAMQREFVITSLGPEDYFAAVDVLATLNLGGPLIYDALILQAARKVNAETIYTWNVRHFQRLAPDLASRIRTPRSECSPAPVSALSGV